MTWTMADRSTFVDQLASLETGEGADLYQFDPDVIDGKDAGGGRLAVDPLTQLAR